MNEPPETCRVENLGKKSYSTEGCIEILGILDRVNEKDLENAFLDEFMMTAMIVITHWYWFLTSLSQEIQYLCGTGIKSFAISQVKRCLRTDFGLVEIILF